MSGLAGKFPSPTRSLAGGGFDIGIKRAVRAQDREGWRLVQRVRTVAKAASIRMARSAGCDRSDLIAPSGGPSAPGRRWK
eukprot:3598043-Prymnesium_polylepis.1